MLLTSAVELRGDLVRLDPVRSSDVDGLGVAAADGELWRLWFTSVPRPEQMADRVAAALAMAASGERLTLTVRSVVDGRILGNTCLLHADEAVPRVEIGGTWYAASVQRSGVNAECKLLLLEHAFETLGCELVELRTHRLNHASRRAIERLGAQLDGILRAQQRLPDGSLRDTAVYSVLAREWPVVRTELRRRLGQT